MSTTRRSTSASSRRGSSHGQDTTLDDRRRRRDGRHRRARLGGRASSRSSTGASAADAQTAQDRADEHSQPAVLAKLKKDYENLPALKKKLAGLRHSVPKEQSIPAFVDELNALAAANGLTIMNRDHDRCGQAVPTPAGLRRLRRARIDGRPRLRRPPPPPLRHPGCRPPSSTAGVPPVTNSADHVATNFAAVPVTVSVTGPYAQRPGVRARHARPVSGSSWSRLSPSAPSATGAGRRRQGRRLHLRAHPPARGTQRQRSTSQEIAPPPLAVRPPWTSCTRCYSGHHDGARPGRSRSGT